MLPNDALTKQGPLARVWLAAHWERKLSKTQLLQTHIPSSVEAIVGEDGEEAPVALRLSGQLLLGIVRIYSRKAKYLEDDCNDALLRIQVAFRSADTVVDLPHDQLHLARTAITLPDTLHVADLWMPEPAFGAAHRTTDVPQNRHAAHPADITLPDSHLDTDIPLEQDALLGEQLPDLDTTAQFDLGIEEHAPPPKRPREWRPRGSSRRSRASDTSRAETSVNEESLPAKESPLPADTSLPSLDADESYASVGVGRDANMATTNDADHVRSLVGDVDLSMDFSMDAMDPPANASTSFSAQAPTPPRERESTPVRDVTFQDAIGANAQLTPRTAAKLRSAALMRAEAPQKGSRKRPIQDTVTDIGRSHVLQMRSAAATMSTSPHELRCLPSLRTHLALLTAPKNLARDTQRALAIAWGTVFSELEPVLRSAACAEARKKHAAPHQETQQWLRDVHEQSIRLTADESEFPQEVGRRAPEAPWLTDDVRFADVSSSTLRSAGDTSVDKSLPPADFSLSELPELPPLPEPTQTAPTQPEPQPEPMDEEPRELRRSSRRRASSSAKGHLPEVRLSTPDAEEQTWQAAPVSDAQPLAAFEHRAQEQPKDKSLASWDTSTLQAMHVLKSTMHEERASFQTLAQNASRRAAAGFFFEMLVLGTKNCVRLEQDEAYGDVDIVAKPALYTSP